jgi:hypothetical protein
VAVIPDSEISPAAYIFSMQDDQDDLKIYEEKSTKVKCPFCDAVSNSIVEYRPSVIGYMLTLLAMLIFGILSLILMPFLVSLTKSAIHRCAKCLNEVKDNSYFGLSSLDDKMFSFSIGNFGVILTRRTILYIVMVLTTMLAIYVFILVEETVNHEITAISSITWAGYKKDCGYEPFLASPRKTKFTFDNRYRFRGVSWDGYVVRVNLNEDPDPLQ